MGTQRKENLAPVYLRPRRKDSYSKGMQPELAYAGFRVSGFIQNLVEALLRPTARKRAKKKSC